MKLIAAPVLALIGSLIVLPVLFTNGDAQTLSCTGAPEVTAVLATIRTLESGSDYTAKAASSSASGAYQFIDSTWGGFGGYEHAWQAPPDVQDAKAIQSVIDILDGHDGDVTAVPVVWYIGRVPPATSPTWETVPAPTAGNTLTPREYQTRWLEEFDRQLAVAQPRDAGGCLPGGAIDAVDDGYAYPGPIELFAAAPVESPHHDYSAWDWMIPTGTPIYAIRGGRIATVRYWPHNWWDRGCGGDSSSCATCGIGVTLVDDAGVRWTYCHGSAVHVGTGDVVAAGAQILTSGNTGRSSGPHLHLQIRTPDELLRCPQALLRSLRDSGRGLDAFALATSGCSF